MSLHLAYSAVDGFTERFTVVQKTLQVMRHFLLKRAGSSGASSHPNLLLNLSAPASAQPQQKAEA